MNKGDIRHKLRILADAAKFDASCASSGSKRSGGAGLGSTQGMGICHSYTPDGRCISLLKVLLTNVCIYDCAYCINRRSSDVERATFEPEEVVRLTMEFYRRNYIEGLFLSSGIRRSADDTLGRMIEVARVLRERERFGGYIHLKAVAGASESLVQRAGLFADRVSVNIELPTDSDLQRLAPEKRRDQIEGAMTAIRGAIDEDRAQQKRRATSRRTPTQSRVAPAGQSTQMIVGATPAHDRDVLSTASGLYSRHRLRRVYYSAYSPIPHASIALPSKSAPLIREHRLYQADWLLRFYGFSVDEVTPHSAPRLDLEIDPKLAWALANRSRFPVDLDRASKEDLLRVPGLGVSSVGRILSTRRHHRITMDTLRAMRVQLRKVAPFIITTDQHRPAIDLLDREDLRSILVPPKQLALFGAVAAP